MLQFILPLLFSQTPDVSLCERVASTRAEVVSGDVYRTSDGRVWLDSGQLNKIYWGYIESQFLTEGSEGSPRCVADDSFLNVCNLVADIHHGLFRASSYVGKDFDEEALVHGVSQLDTVVNAHHQGEWAEKIGIFPFDMVVHALPSHLSPDDPAAIIMLAAFMEHADGFYGEYMADVTSLAIREHIALFVQSEENIHRIRPFLESYLEFFLVEKHILELRHVVAEYCSVHGSEGCAPLLAIIDTWIALRKAGLAYMDWEVSVN